MAVTLAGLDVVTSKWYSDSVIDNAFLTNLLFAILWERRRTIQGGTDFVQPVVLTVPTAVGSYAGNQIISVPYDQNIFGAEFNMAQYYSGVQVTDQDDWINMGPPAVLNLLETRCILSDMALRDFIGTDMQGSGTPSQASPNPLIGLALAVANTGVYGNIDRAVFANWQANVTSAGAPGAFTLALANTAAWNATRDSDRPDLYITTRGVMAKLTTLTQPAQRFVREDAYLASIGFSNILFMDRPVVMDEHVPTSPFSLWYGLNTKYLHLYVQMARSFRYIPFQMQALQNSAIQRTLVALALVCGSPRSQLVITGIDPTL